MPDVHVSIPYDDLNGDRIHMIHNQAEQIRFVKIMYTTAYCTINNLTIRIWEVGIGLERLIRTISDIQTLIYKRLMECYPTALVPNCIVSQIISSISMIMNNYSTKTSYNLRIFGISLHKDSMSISYKIV